MNFHSNLYLSKLNFSSAYTVSVNLVTTKYNVTYNRICLIAPYFPNISYISSAVILNGRFLTYRTLFTSGGNRTFARLP